MKYTLNLQDMNLSDLQRIAKNEDLVYCFHSVLDKLRRLFKYNQTFTAEDVLSRISEAMADYGIDLEELIGE